MLITIQPTSLELVRDTFVSVLFAQQQAAALFYDRLFEQAPETRSLFRDDLEEQCRMFMQALARIVTGLDRLDLLLPELQALGQRHVEYGVEERHYAIVGAALCHMVRELSGPLYNAEIESAWCEAYAVVSRTMIDASYNGQIGSTSFVSISPRECITDSLAQQHDRSGLRAPVEQRQPPAGSARS